MKAGHAILALLLVTLATILQMAVDWMQSVRDPSTTTIVKAAILGTGFLSILALILALKGGGKI